MERGSRRRERGRRGAGAAFGDILIPRRGAVPARLARAGRALARNDILDAVWGDSVIVTPRSIDRCVTTLRAKIEPDPHNPTYIQTIRDIGYRFETGDA